MRESESSAANQPGERCSAPEAAFQYSLRSLLIVTTVLAILCSAVFATPRRYGVPLSVFLTMSANVILWSNRRHPCRFRRAFAWGGQFGLLVFVTILFISPAFHDLMHRILVHSELDPNVNAIEWKSIRRDGLALWTLAVLLGPLTVVLSGLAAAGIGRWIDSRRR